MALALRKLSQLARKKSQPEPGLTRYWDPHLGKRTVKLRPGEQHLSGTDEMLVTVAGVTSVLCLKDPNEGLIGMVSFCVPTQEISSLDASGYAQAERYGRQELDKLIMDFRKAGSSLQNLEACIIGGTPAQKSDERAIGDTLCLIRQYLAKYEIQVVAEYLESQYSKKVYWNLQDHCPQVRILKEVSGTVANREKHYQMKLRAGWLLGNRKTSMQFS